MENKREPQAREPNLSSTDAPSLSSAFALPNLILASQSPRRAEILRAVGWPFHAQAADIDETKRARETASAYVERLARTKSEWVAAQRNEANALVLGADTIVCVGREVFGKPRDAGDARHMLRRLSGRWHDVLTGVALLRQTSNGNENAHESVCLIAHERTRVRFSPLRDDEIEWYVATNEPMDKAGAYAVQGRAALFIEEIRGDYWNVVGLPVHRLYQLARQAAGMI